MSVALRPLAEVDRDAVLALRVAPGQERFVSSVEQSLAQAAEHPGAHAITFAVVDADGSAVGFVMVADEVEGEDYIPHYLWKLLIDARHQRRGLGSAALELVVAWFRERSAATAITLSAGEGEGSPIPFYERRGFVRTGEKHDDEVLMRRELAQPAT